ncbi:DUF202 domain-containing protein [Escherichia coli]
MEKRPITAFSLANERTFLAWIRTALRLWRRGLRGLINLRQIFRHARHSRTAGVVVVSVFRRVSDVWLLALVTQ